MPKTFVFLIIFKGFTLFQENWEGPQPVPWAIAYSPWWAIAYLGPPIEPFDPPIWAHFGVPWPKQNTYVFLLPMLHQA